MQLIHQTLMHPGSTDLGGEAAGDPSEFNATILDDDHAGSVREYTDV